MPGNALHKACDLMVNRMVDLEDERKRLERALAELRGNAGRHRSADHPRIGNAARKPRRPNGDNRADQALAMIGGKPGITASDVAESMKIKPNYLYRVLGELEKRGQVKKDGRRYFLAGSEFN